MSCVLDKSVLSSSLWEVNQGTLETQIESKRSTGKEMGPGLVEGVR